MSVVLYRVVRPNGERGDGFFMKPNAGIALAFEPEDCTIEPVHFVPLSVAQGLADALKETLTMIHDDYAGEEPSVTERVDRWRAALAAFSKEGGKTT